MNELFLRHEAICRNMPVTVYDEMCRSVRAIQIHLEGGFIVDLEYIDSMAMVMAQNLGELRRYRQLQSRESNQEP